MTTRPNKRLKLAGGDRVKGSGVLCPWRGTDPTMILELGTGTRIQDPTPDQVERGLRSLPGGPDSYAVMKSSDGVFLQVLGGVADGDFHMLEYCEGAEEL